MIATPPSASKTAQHSVARWLSILAHPFVLIGVLVATSSTLAAPAGEAPRTTALVIGFVVVPMAVLIFRQRHLGIWKDVDASRKADRPALYAVGFGTLLALLIYLRVSSTHAFLVHGIIIVLALLAVCAALTRWIKVSLHLACAALTATTLTLMGSPVGWIVAVFLIPLAWSRLALGRHSLKEVVVGATLGAVAGCAVHFFSVNP